MLDYSFFAPRQIVFGWGRRAELATHAARFGRRALLVSGSRTLEANGSVEELSAKLRAAGLEVLSFQAATREPEVRDVDRLAAEFRALEPAGGDVEAGPQLISPKRRPHWPRTGTANRSSIFWRESDAGCRSCNRHCP